MLGSQSIRRILEPGPACQPAFWCLSESLWWWEIKVCERFGQLRNKVYKLPGQLRPLFLFHKGTHHGLEGVEDFQCNGWTAQEGGFWREVSFRFTGV